MQCCFRRERMHLTWITPWTRVCGIADYSKALWPAVAAELQREGHQATLVSLDEYPTARALVARLKELGSDVIHFQHEYGIYGGKNPPFYRFPSMVKAVREGLPGARIIATAHTVLPQGYQFPTQGRGLEVPFRALANSVLGKRLNHLWHQKTWGGLDGVIVHSQYQVSSVQAAGCSRVVVIPHFVPKAGGLQGTVPREVSGEAVAREILVFGFFTPEKGQDIAIEAFAELNLKLDRARPVRLVLAGGVRRKRDQAYLADCRMRVRELKLSHQVEVTGFVEKQKVDSYFARAALVLAPFRETSGSGSLAQALARRVPILASDLILNREIAERVPGALAFFKSEDPKDCAEQMFRLLGDDMGRRRLGEAAGRYAQMCSPEAVARAHFEAYRGG